MISTYALNSTNYLTSITYETRKKRNENCTECSRWNELRFDAGDNTITLINWKDDTLTISASEGWRDYWRGYEVKTRTTAIYLPLLISEINKRIDAYKLM